jgi:predicted nicotinamide N-methyase
VLWNGSIILGKIIEYQSPISIEGKSVLELGAGCCGIPGQIAAALGARVVLTDIRDELEGLQNNVDLNAQYQPISVIVQELNWDDVKSQLALPTWMQGMTVNVILCADLVYEKTYKLLAITLLLILQLNPDCVVLMSNAMRKHVHLFRRKMNAYCNFDDILTADFLSDSHDVVWIITLKKDADFTTIYDAFVD